MKVNEHAVGEMPFPEPHSDLHVMFAKRERGWPEHFPGNLIDAPAISYMAAPLRYIDERQYEVFKMGDIFRDAEGQALSQRRETWNGVYDFDFRFYLTSSHVADRSWAIHQYLDGDWEELPPAPEVILFATDYLTKPSSLFTRQKIELKLRERWKTS